LGDLKRVFFFFEATRQLFLNVFPFFRSLLPFLLFNYPSAFFPFLKMKQILLTPFVQTVFLLFSDFGSLLLGFRSHYLPTASEMIGILFEPLLLCHYREDSLQFPPAWSSLISFSQRAHTFCVPLPLSFQHFLREGDSSKPQSLPEGHASPLKAFYMVRYRARLLPGPFSGNP